MAKRYYFKAENIYEDKEIDFTFYNGFSLTQKQKSIESMHKEISKIEKGNILEISSKSQNYIGRLLSAFNLKLTINNIEYYLENVFQSSKVFEFGGPYKDLLIKTPIEAKKDERIRNSGKLIHFDLDSIIYPIEPKTLFYDWIYCNAVHQNSALKEEIIKFEIFTDIEFNHNRSINCQARSAAIYVGLFKTGNLETALKSIENFMKIVYRKETIFEQITMQI